MIFSTKMRVVRYRSKTEFGSTQRLLKELRLFGLKVWTIEIDSEEVPAWAEIQVGALGSTEWKSKFADYI